MIIKHIFAAAAVATLMGSSLALAQTAPAPAPAAAAPDAMKAAKPSKMQKAQTPESAACYVEADKQNLHGRKRKAFHHKCMVEAKAKPKA